MENQPSIARVALKWGVITGVALVLYSTLLYTLDILTNRGLSLIVYVILAVGLVLGMREYRTANGGYMTYGNGINIGALLSAVAGFISSAFSVFYTQIIDTGFQNRINEQIRAQMEEQGNLSDEQIDQALEIAQKFQSPGITFVVGIAGTVLVGVILSLIISAVIRRNKANPFD